jgi:hypothetical protein
MMQMKSSASLQGAVLSDVKEILSLIGDSKKAKEQIELLLEDVAVFKDLYQKNQAELEKLELIKSEIDSEKINLNAEKEKIKEEKKAVDKEKLEAENLKKSVDINIKKLEIEKFQFRANVEKEHQEIEAKAFMVAKQSSEATELKKLADDLIAEYEEKLSKLKAMVG